MKLLVYLDNCCFNRPFDPQQQIRVQLETESKLALQTEIRAGVIQLAWSYMLDFENDANPSPSRKESISRWKSYATSDTTQTEEILSTARELHASGLKKKDAIHLACAISMKCDCFFTTDDGILKKRNEIRTIRILNPIEYYANYND